jgi:hypothetical protein
MKKAGLSIADGVAEAMKAVEESELMRNVRRNTQLIVSRGHILRSYSDLQIISHYRSPRRQRPFRPEYQRQQLQSETPKLTRLWRNL